MGKKNNTEQSNETQDTAKLLEEINKELEEKNKELEAKEKEHEEKCKILNDKLEELNDKYLRVYAEFDNYKKRSVKEKDEAYSLAYVNAVKEILPIIDNMERAQAFEGGVSEGVNMIITSMKSALEKMGVSEIETKTFDPNYHNAVMHIDDEAYNENEIVEVFQKGYKLKDKVIRYAMVKVAN